MRKHLQKQKEILFRVLSVGLSISILFLVLEIMLRFLPVHQGKHSLPVNEGNPTPRFEPNRTFVWSKGFNFAMVNQVGTNNFGFINEVDYDTHATSPLIAIIGDSYVEALMVPFKETITGRLAESLGNAARVYSFATSGSPLSQYLAYAEYAQNNFQPDGIVIVVIGNDFDESLMKYKSARGNHYFVEDTNGDLVLKRVDFDVSFIRRLVRKSALASYFAINVGLKKLPQRLGWFLSWKNRYELFVGNTSSNTDSTRVADSKRAVDAFFKELRARSGLCTDKILFVIDGMRPHLYEGKQELARGSYFDLMRRYFITSARDKGYEVIDMEGIFANHYKKHGDRFEYPVDTHWNSLGHEVVFDAVRRSSFFARFTIRGR